MPRHRRAGHHNGYPGGVLFGRRTPMMVNPASALPGRSEPLAVPERHEVLGTPLQLQAGQTPEGAGAGGLRNGLLLGRGADLLAGPRGVHDSGWLRGRHHAQPHLGGVLGAHRPRGGGAGVFDPAATSYEEIAEALLGGPDPTRRIRQGADVGTQYRSAIVWQSESQRAQAESSKETYQRMLSAAGHGEIATGLIEGPPAHPFYYAESLPSAVSRQEPRRLLRAGRHGGSCPVGLATSG